jgi:tetratricopeptide (TPR) repeat protein
MSNVSEQSSVVDEASTWFDLGCTLQNAERPEEALSAFTQAQAIDPSFPFLRHRIAWTHFMLKNFPTALGLYETLVRENPGDGSAWSDLSITAHRCRQWDKALAAAALTFTALLIGSFTLLDAYNAQHATMSADQFHSFVIQLMSIAEQKGVPIDPVYPTGV